MEHPLGITFCCDRPLVFRAGDFASGTNDSVTSLLPEVNMRRSLTVAIFVFVVSLAGLSQDAGTSADNSSSAKTSSAAELPKLEKFDRSLLDASKDPCTDFYQYT